MSACLTLLDQALILAQHEIDALNEGDVESAEAHFMDRAEILTTAYRQHDEESNDDYMIKLVALQGYNQAICEVGTALKEKLRTEIMVMNKSSVGLRGYHKVMAS